MLTLYHYVHCPFCLRVRMALGYLNLEYQSVVVSYDDESTPVRLTDKKMLPILEYSQGSMNESLDIIAFLDVDNKLNVTAITSSPDFKNFDSLLNHFGGPVHSLAMPYWIWTPEFNDQSREYFQRKKEVKRGPFKELVIQKNEFIQKLESDWPRLEKELIPFYRSDKLGLRDLLLASHLWGLYVVPEFQFPPAIHTYLQRVKVECNFNYHQDFWS